MSSIRLFVKKIIKFLCIASVLLLLLCFAVKGQKVGKRLLYQGEYTTQVGGPFEASNSTSRYALLEAIVTHKTFFLRVPLARFASPDVVYYQGKYTSLFTPGISFLGIPFYFIGSLFGIPQLFTYALTLVAAIGTVFLIAAIAKKIGASTVIGFFAGMVFLFATNAFVYSLTLTQHIVSTLIVLSALLITLSLPSFIKNILFGVLFGIGLLVDIPNGFFLFPLLMYLLARHITLLHSDNGYTVHINTVFVGLLIGIIPLLMLFGWYNHQTTGSFTKLGQTIGRSDNFKSLSSVQNTPVTPTLVDKAPKALGMKLALNTRDQLSGMYTLLLSDERAWWYYSPIIFIGVFGLFLLYRQENTRIFSLLALVIVGVNILLYSLFGDPWGGWSFGPRYLIPAAGVLCIGIAPAVKKYKKNPLFITVFWVLLLYSLAVNMLGALTTASIPPKIEAVHLQTAIPYTYMYNKELLLHNFSSSLFYNLFLSQKITAQVFYFFLFGIFSMVFIILYICLFFVKERYKK